MNIGFDNDKYLKLQSENIKKRIARFDNKLYLEFGGKLFDDYHAARVLPGFKADSKIMLLRQFKDDAELIFCISAEDIEKNKIRADLNITYDTDILRLIENMRRMGIYIGSVVITKFSGQSGAVAFKNRLENLGIRVYTHALTKGYPTDVDTIVSDEGYGANPYIETTRPLVVVTAPGPGSGKLATCLSQMYHEYRRGNKPGYAKYETFPIWNLPLKHPVNLAYEAATADLNDVNMIDPFHLEAYGVTTVNYNRDVEAFPIVRTIIEKITGDKSVYQSPTDMGVNMVGFCITDDAVVKEAARQEIIRRYYRVQLGVKHGTESEASLHRIERLMKLLEATKADRPVVETACTRSAETGGKLAMAIELDDGRIISGRTTELMYASASVLLNAIKTLAGIGDAIPLLSPVVLEPILRLKHEDLHSRHALLNSEEVLIALSICAATNPTADVAIKQLGRLRGCEAHSSHMIPGSDEAIFRKLGINLTSEPVFPSDSLYQ